MKVLGKNRFMQLVAIIALVAAMLSVHSVAFAQNQLQKYRDSSINYEEVVAQIIEIDEEGNGLLRIYEEDCADCYIDAPFDARVSLNTPLGHYYGLDKLANWGDRPMQIKVSRDTEQVVSVWVLSNN